MNGDIVPLTIEQFTYLLKNDWNRKITSVHVHHTWKPHAAQWAGYDTVESIRRYHMQHNGWSDLAQHLTIGPDGSLYTGRHLDRAPASISGLNGNGISGPFMIEMVGDFDIGRDPFGGLQASATYQVIAAICRRFSLIESKVRFHNEFSTAKSCPGSSLSLNDFRAEVKRAIGSKPSARDIFIPIRGLVAPLLPHISPDEDANGELDYLDPVSSRGFFSPKFSEDDLALFQRHVINTDMGKLSSTGLVKSSRKSIESLLDHLDTWANQVERPRVVMFAHGGLVSEEVALQDIVLRDTAWWLENNVYPIYFVWETGLLEVLKRQAGPESEFDTSQRGFFDPVLEKITGFLVGRPAWEKIKASGFLASQAQTESGEAGGLYQFAATLSERLSRRYQANKTAIELHAVGHSAGAILLCHMLPVLDRFMRNDKTKSIKKRKRSIKSLSLLAPACRVDLFKSKLLPMINHKKIASFAEFAMDETTERNDNVINVYRKSLLYYVRNACEPDSPLILGLQESIREDHSLRNLFGLDPDSTGKAELILSPTGNLRTGKCASQSTSHGDFDNDEATMNSVLRRIFNWPDASNLMMPRVLLPKLNHVDTSSTTQRTNTVANIGQSDTSIRPQQQLGISTGDAHALCIGIDEYSDAPLSGCVADAMYWASTFSQYGVNVHKPLINGRATKQGIIDAWRDVCDQAKPGDTVIIQYSGHGTQVADKSGDESDGLDEAWVTFDYKDGNVLLDDEIGSLIDSYEKVGIQMVLFTDCCHSGSGSRARDAQVSKIRGSRFMSVISLPGFARAYTRSSERWASELPGRELDTIGSEVHFAGCQDHQSSYENNGHGDFTLAAVDALMSSSLGASYADIYVSIKRAFSDNPLQTPMFRAKPDKSQLGLFGAVATKGTPSAPVRTELSAICDRLDKLESMIDELR